MIVMKTKSPEEEEDSEELESKEEAKEEEVAKEEEEDFSKIQPKEMNEEL